MSSPKRIARTEVTRLQREIEALKFLLTIPRRLGSDATSAELSLDKQRARRVLHVKEQMLAEWGGPLQVSLNGHRKVGAQLNWGTWEAEQQIHVKKRISYLEHWRKEHSKKQQRQWANSTLHKLRREHRLLKHALR